MKVDWEAIEDAVLDYGGYRENGGHVQPDKQEIAEYGFEATMEKIHDEIRKAGIGGDDDR